MPSFYATLPRGFSKSHLRRTRSRLHWQGLVEIHHVIPRELARHPRLLAEGYDVEGSYNTIFAPSAVAHRLLTLSDTRPVHSGGHPRYNAFVRDQLDACEPGLDAFLALLWVCHQGSRGRVRVPWK